MTRVAFGVYALIAYAVGMASVLYAMGFIANAVVPKSIDFGGATDGFALAMLVNVALIAVFGLQHSLMARPGVKRWLRRIAPPPIERATYMLASAAAIALLFWFWRPIPVEIWNVEAPALRTLIWGAFLLGWAVMFAASFSIDHFELFGLRQAYNYFIGKAPKRSVFTVRWLYILVRHPISTGWLMVIWITPTMTVGRLLFAVGLTTYIAVATRFEERDLIEEFGVQYRAYKTRVRAFVPWPKLWREAREIARLPAE